MSPKISQKNKKGVLAMKFRIVEREVLAYLLSLEPDGIEVELDDETLQRFRDVWDMWRDVQAEIAVRYQSALSKHSVSFEVDGPNVSRTDQQFIEP